MGESLKSVYISRVLTVAPGQEKKMSDGVVFSISAQAPQRAVVLGSKQKSYPVTHVGLSKGKLTMTLKDVGVEVSADGNLAINSEKMSKDGSLGLMWQPLTDVSKTVSADCCPLITRHKKDSKPPKPAEELKGNSAPEAS